MCTAFQYDGPIRKTIVDWKEHQHAAARARIRNWFDVGLRPLVEQLPNLRCVPIPSSPTNDRLRGGAVLTEVLRATGLPMSDALVAARVRKDQAGLARAERERNLHNAFAWHGSDDAAILLVDDVVTSGATMRSAARAVHAGGGHVWAGFGLARRGRLATIQSTQEGLAWGNPMQGGTP